MLESHISTQSWFQDQLLLGIVSTPSPVHTLLVFFFFYYFPGMGEVIQGYLCERRGGGRGWRLSKTGYIGSAPFPGLPDLGTAVSGPFLFFHFFFPPCNKKQS